MLEIEKKYVIPIEMREQMFLEYVDNNREIGYGKMINLIFERWQEVETPKLSELSAFNNPEGQEGPSFEDLSNHVGHDIECVTYGDGNITIECNICNEVIYSVDKDRRE